MTADANLGHAAGKQRYAGRLICSERFLCFGKRHARRNNRRRVEVSI